MEKVALRKIIHIDMDAFYASVEQRDQPSLRGKPLIVGGSPDARGVVAACSYEARKFGVRSAMSCRRAVNLCPQAIIVRPRMDRYQEVSRAIRKLFYAVTDLVEPLSLDEAYLDVTTNKLAEVSATRIAMSLRAQIKSELNLTASAGVGPNKFIAKVASDLRKPDGLSVIPPDQARAFVASLPIERFWGVGPATAKKLHARGIRTGADIEKIPLATLHHWFGRFGTFLHELSQGIDLREVTPNREPKSRGSETTFNTDITDLALLSKTIRELAEDVAGSLQKLNKAGTTITLKVKYSDFSQITRSRTVNPGTTDIGVIEATALDLLKSSTEAGRRPIRLLGVSVKIPAPAEVTESDIQLNLEV